MSRRRIPLRMIRPGAPLTVAVRLSAGEIAAIHLRFATFGRAVGVAPRMVATSGDGLRRSAVPPGDGVRDNAYARYALDPPLASPGGDGRLAVSAAGGGPLALYFLDGARRVVDVRFEIARAKGRRLVRPDVADRWWRRDLARAARLGPPAHRGWRLLALALALSDDHEGDDNDDDEAGAGAGEPSVEWGAKSARGPVGEGEFATAGRALTIPFRWEARGDATPAARARREIDGALQPGDRFVLLPPGARLLPAGVDEALHSPPAAPGEVTVAGAVERGPEGAPRLILPPLRAPEHFLRAGPPGRAALFEAGCAAALLNLTCAAADAPDHLFLALWSPRMLLTRARGVLFDSTTASPPPDPEARAAAAAARLSSLDQEADVRALAGGGLFVRRRLAGPRPVVSAIVPTRDQPEALGAALRTLREARVDEIIVADNQSRDPRTLAVAASFGARVLFFPGVFNFAAMNNAAARVAAGKWLLFFNNDVEASDPSWLAELAGLLAEGDVAAAGPLLCYPDGSVQHAGVIVGPMGGAAHAFRFFDPASPDFMNGRPVAREFSALTAACLLVKKEAFQEVGGFDEEHLPVSFNDVDLGLRLVAAGKRLLFTPHARLTHRESLSRPRLADAEEVAFFRRRWAAFLRAGDPCYHPGLTTMSDDSGLGIG